MDFYKVMFYDKREEKYKYHYVQTSDMRVAKNRIEGEEPYVEVVSWEKISEEELPMIAVVISK